MGPELIDERPTAEDEERTQQTNLTIKQIIDLTAGHIDWPSIGRRSVRPRRPEDDTLVVRVLAAIGQFGICRRVRQIDDPALRRELDRLLARLPGVCGH